MLMNFELFIAIGNIQSSLMYTQKVWAMDKDKSIFFCSSHSDFDSLYPTSLGFCLSLYFYNLDLSLRLGWHVIPFLLGLFCF